MVSTWYPPRWSSVRSFVFLLLLQHTPHRDTLESANQIVEVGVVRTGHDLTAPVSSGV
jgi:hypothetical protein